MSDKKMLYGLSLLTFAVLPVFFLLPGENSGRIATLVWLGVAALCMHFLIKKRSIPSMHKGQILLLMTTIGFLSLMLLYLTGLSAGFVRNPYARPAFFLSRALPAAGIILASEYIRYVLRSQDDRWADVIGYFLCTVAEILALSSTVFATSVSRFMDFVGIVIFPAIISNFLYHYLAKRYGMLPNLVYRLIISLYIYVIPFESAMPDAILAFAKVIIPIVTYAFLDALYEKKRHYALKRVGKLGIALTIACVLFLGAVVMLISNQFRYGALVIATPSMTGELNVGDVAIFEQYENPKIAEGQVIVFEKDGSVVVHRVVKIETINGRTRYYTKGDANEDWDDGFRYKSDIIGHVNWKVPFIGYPTLWFRSLF